MLDDQDQGTRVGVWVTLSLIAFLLFGLIGGLVIRQMHQKQAVAAVEPVAVVVTEALIEGPLTGDLAATVFFELDAATLPAGADAELVKVKAALDAAPARKLVLSGFHDASGDPAHNAELAKQRAIAVREAMRILGVESGRIGLRKPESTTGDGNAQEARRVELRLVD
ncbi:MAG TPA: OmpA family protein [Ideonella sp.]|nr:OmpA family protein [Ideonella sp.]